MTTRSIRGGPGSAGSTATLVAIALTVSLLAPPARAASGGDTDEGWKKVVAFARCAVNVFRAVTPADWTVAFLDCTRLYLEEPALPGGGQP